MIDSFLCSVLQSLPKPTQMWTKPNEDPGCQHTGSACSNPCGRIARCLTYLSKHFRRTTPRPPLPSNKHKKNLRHPVPVKLLIADSQNHQGKLDDNTERERQQLRRGDRVHLSLLEKNNLKANYKFNISSSSR